MKGITLVILIAVLAVYVLVGGAIFMALESSNEDTTRSTTLTAYKDFITAQTCVTDAELETFVKAIISAYEQGIIATEQTSSASQWSYGNSVFFAMTAVTTIGYGNQSPVTFGGRTFLIFFAIFGIPLCGVMLAAIGEKNGKLQKFLNKKEFTQKHKKLEKVLKGLVIPFIFFCLFVLIPSAIFTAVEDWTYGESIYYCVVTLTTIGFGDFVIGTNDSDYRIAYRLLTAVWIFVGLSFVATIITSSTETYGEYVKRTEQKLNEKVKKEKGIDVNTDSGKEEIAVGEIE